MKSVTLKKIVLIGASTGGPGQIQNIITSLPKLHDTSIIIAQHMVDGFLESFASRLQDITSNSVDIIKNKQKLDSSQIYICEGSTQLNIENFTFEVKKSIPNSYNPDINNLFASFVPLCQRVDILTIILTGIGSDGVSACVKLKENGSRCVTESEKSAIVDGMPNRARALVPNIEVHELDAITKIINEFANV